MEGQSGVPDFDDAGLEEDDEVADGEEDPLMIDEEDDINSEGDRISHKPDDPKADRTSKSENLNLQPESFVETESPAESQTTAAA